MSKHVVRGCTLLALLAWGGCALAADAAALPQSLGLKPPTDSSFLLGGLKALLIGALLLALVGVVLWWWRRKLSSTFAPSSAGIAPPLLQSSRRISQKTLLMVVQWQGHSYLLAETGTAVQLIDKAATVPATEISQ